MSENTSVNGSLALEKPAPIVKVIEATNAPTPDRLRIAAYARVSSNSDDQLNSFAAQVKHYNDLIQSEDTWVMIDVYADDGITGTCDRKRPEFLKMIRQCKQGKIDIVLTKSISANVKWGQRQAMREGKVVFQYARMYGYERGEDGKPKIIPEQAAVVERIFNAYLAGNSVRAIKEMLEREHIRTSQDTETWSVGDLQGMLRNEKYCGDALLQKTFTQDSLSKKDIKNTGQLPKYLVQNHHEGIITRELFDRVQTEISRRVGTRAPSAKASVSGLAKYSSKYALTGMLVCGECGTAYRRCVWSKNGNKRVVWRCISRLDYGTKYCKNSPTLEESQIHRTILAAHNSEIRKLNDELAELRAKYEQSMTT